MTDTEEKTYTFDELSDKAKQHARERHTGGDYLDYDWWDNVYEDAVSVATILGITIGTRDVKLMNGKTRQQPDIRFSGFCSQGDGACFTGDYMYNPKAVEEINAYCNEAELIRIAEQFNAMQIQQRLEGREFADAVITLSQSRYCHSNTMDVDIGSELRADGQYAPPEEVNEKDFTQLFRDFADWIYKSLEAQHDWLHSDECVDSAFDDETFDEDGNTV